MSQKIIAVKSNKMIHELLVFLDMLMAIMIFTVYTYYRKLPKQLHEKYWYINSFPTNIKFFLA